MILLISSVFPPEPVVSAAIGNDLADTLSKKWKVKVVTPRPSRPMGFSFKEGSINKGNFEHIVLNSFICPKSKLFGRMRESYSFGKHVVNYIKKNKTEIECMYIHAWPLLAPFFIVKAARRYCIPSVIHIVDIYPEALFGKLPFFKNIFIRLLLPIDKYALKNSSRIVTISPNMKNMLVRTRNLKEQNIDVIYNWRDEDFFMKYKSSGKKQQRNDLFTFMFLGNLSGTAAIKSLINAFKISGLANSRLIIAGNGAEKDSLISLAGSFKDIAIEFWDAPWQEVPEIQDKADVLLLSLKRGAAHLGLPSKLSAYMFSGKPIIASVDKDSDTAITIEKANCGWVVAPDDLDELASVMKASLLIPENELQNIGKNGYHYALENFSKKSNLEKFVNLINELVEE